MQAWALLHVNDVDAHLAFYAERLGWQVGERPTAGLAFVRDHAGGAVLLATSAEGCATDLAAYLEPGAREKRPGDTLRYPEEALAARRAELERRGLAGLRIKETLWRDRELLVAAPEGYTVAFVESASLSDDEALALYLSAPTALDAALDGLSEHELDHAPRVGAWSIRQLAHHIVDGDDLWALVIKAALAAPDCLYEQDWYDTDNASVETLRYASLPLEPAQALFRAQRIYIASLIQHLPDAWQRTVRFLRAGGEPQSVTPQMLIRMQARHALEHISEIQRLRRVREH